MGILGEASKEEIHDRLKAQAQAFHNADPGRETMVAFHLIHSVAQAAPGPDGSFIYHNDDSLVRDYISFTRDHGMLLFLDLQNGRLNVEAEVQQILTYLLEPHVHLALDPEFTMGP